MVGDLLDASAFRCLRLVATEAWWQSHPKYASMTAECFVVSPAEMQRVSLLQTPQDVLAVFALPTGQQALQASPQQLTLLLDEVQDPGNLGTIIRTADWFGVRHIYCTPGTADCYNPKVVQATMSALARVSLHYFDDKADCCEWLKQRSCPIYGTFLDGTDIYRSELASQGVLVMGNEGRGVSAEIAQCVTHRLLIPSFSPDGAHVESLNVSIATAVCLSELRRR